MSYVLRGTTIAHYGNPHHTYDLAGATLVFYKAGERVGGSTMRWGWKAVDEAGMRVTELGRALVDDDGRYECALREAHEGAILVALSVKRFRYTPDTGRAAYGLLGVVQPDWAFETEVQGVRRTEVDVVLRTQGFCDVLEALDLWLVAGRVVDCATRSLPLAGGQVTAFDRDVQEDDALGTVSTDATGSFSIFVPGSLVRPPPSPSAPQEGLHELFGGPDLYFLVCQGDTTLLQETPSVGRGPDRENVGRCSYSVLCVDQGSWTPQTLTLWTHIGDWPIPDGGGLNAFDADGFLDQGKRPMTGGLDFNGQLSPTWLGKPVRYRFLYAPWTDGAVAPTYPADYQPLLAVHLDLGAPYGALYTWLGPSPWDCSTADVLPVPDDAGWIAVDQRTSSLRTTGRLVRVRSAALTPPTADLPQKFSFILEVATDDGTLVPPLPVPIQIHNPAPDVGQDTNQV